MKRLGFILLALLLAGSAVALAASLRRAPAATPTDQTAAEPTPLDPLTIAAIRQHPLTKSSITVTQTLPARGGCQTQIVSFTSDGLIEYALMSTPAVAKPSAGYPVIILAHGYIDPDSYQTAGSDYQSFINAYCQAGYMVLKPDYRGNGQSHGDPTTGDLDPGYSYDLLNLTDSLGSLPTANAKQVAWLGHSMGGAVVLRAAVASHNLPVKAVILASGVVGSLQDIFYNWPAAMLPADLAPVRQNIIQMYGAPPAHPEFWHDASAINYVNAIPAPVQINHGTADQIVPLAFSQSLDQALTAAGKPHQLVTYSGGDHQYSAPGVQAQFLANSLAFMHAVMK